MSFYFICYNAARFIYNVRIYLTFGNYFVHLEEHYFKMNVFYNFAASEKYHWWVDIPVDLKLHLWHTRFRPILTFGRETVYLKI